MIKRIILLPFWIIYKCIGVIAKVIQFLVGIGFGTIWLVLKRVLVGIYAATIGLLFGRRKIGLRLFGKK